MDLKKILSGGMGLSMVKPVVNYIQHDTERLKELLVLLDKGDIKLQHHTSYALFHVALNDAQLLLPHCALFLNLLQRKNIHESTKRNVLRCFQELDCPEAFVGELLEQCYLFMKNAAHAPALIAFAINVAAPICKRYPELIEEFLLVLKELQQFHTAPSVLACIKKAQKVVMKKGKH